MLGLQFDVPALQLPLAPLTTLAPTTTVGQLFLNPFGFETQEAKTPGIFPSSPGINSINTSKNNSLQPPAFQIFKDPEYPNARPPAIEPLPPGYGMEVTADPTPTPSPSPVNYYSTTPYQLSAFVTLPPEPTTVPPDYEDERNVESPPFQSTGGGGTYMSNEMFQDNSVVSYGNFVNYETTLPPSTIPGYYGGTPYMSVYSTLPLFYTSITGLLHWTDTEVLCHGVI